eukprot:scaffold132211_cov48-Phaeocystis_antarctica.AAC.1
MLRFLGVIFDGDHDLERPRSSKAHLDKSFLCSAQVPFSKCHNNEAMFANKRTGGRWRAAKRSRRSTRAQQPQARSVAACATE